VGFGASGERGVPSGIFVSDPQSRRCPAVCPRNSLPLVHSRWRRWRPTSRRGTKVFGVASAACQSLSENPGIRLLPFPRTIARHQKAVFGPSCVSVPKLVDAVAVFLAKQRNGNSYFIERVLHIMLDAEDAFLSAIINRCLVKTGAQGSGERERDGAVSRPQLAAALARGLPKKDLFTLHTAFHAYLYLIGQSNADLVVNATRLARSRAHREYVQHQLSVATRLQIYLTDAVEIQQYESFDPTTIDWHEIRETVDFAVAMLDHLYDRGHLRRFASEFIEETRAEIETSERYVSSARDVVNKLTSERDASDQQCTSKAVELARVSEENARLQRELGEARAAGQRLIFECEALCQIRDRLTADCERLSRERSQIENDRDRAAAEGERWFAAAIRWPKDLTPAAPARSRREWLHRVRLRWVDAADRWFMRMRRRKAPRLLADQARNAGQWELAARTT